MSAARPANCAPRSCYCVTRVRRLTFTFLITLFTLVVARADRAGGEAAAVARAQDTQSTMAGVFSAPQAARGEETYMGVCVSCHPAGTYKTAAFRANWKGRPLSDLFDQVREKMPKNDPASLSQMEYAQIIAYLLKINGVPAGETELAPDAEGMKKIRIEMPEGQ
jgi:cytochrome c553